jgi:hypothetical protein
MRCLRFCTPRWPWCLVIIDKGTWSHHVELKDTYDLLFVMRCSYRSDCEDHSLSRCNVGWTDRWVWTFRMNLPLLLLPSAPTLTKRLLSCRFSSQNHARIFPPPFYRACHIHGLFYLLAFNHLQRHWLGIQIIMLLWIAQFSPPSFYFLLLRIGYCPQQRDFIQPQPVLFSV